MDHERRERERQHKKHQRLGVLIAAINIFITSMAVVSMAFTATWISIAGSNALPTRINVFAAALSELELDPLLEGILFFTGQYTTSVAAGWPVQNNAVRLTAAVMVVVAAWFTFLIAANFISRRVALVLLLVWSAVELALSIAACVLDGQILVETLENCRDITCPPGLDSDTQKLLCQCQPNGFSWGMLGIDIALALGLFLLVFVYSAVLCTSSFDLPTASHHPKQHHVYTDDVEVQDFNGTADGYGDAYPSNDAPVYDEAEPSYA